MSELRQIRAFVEVAQRGSFTAAAEVLATSATSVSRAIKDLEHDLGCRLLNRSTRKVALTPAGYRYAERCRHVLTELAEARSEVRARQEGLNGKLRIASPTSFGLHRLEPVLTSFARQNPAIELELNLQETPPDLITGGYDVVILGARAGFNAAIPARKLCTVEVILSAAPSYIARQGAPLHPSDTHHFDLIDIDHAISQGRWQLQGPDGLIDVAPLRQARYSTNHADVALRMALQGLGIAPLPDFMVARHLAQGSLIRVLEAWSLQRLNIYAALPAQQLVEPKVTALLDYLSDAFSARSSKGSGE